MSKIVVVNMLSLDGYTEGPGGNVMAMPMDLAFDSHNAERLRAADSILFGGTTYRGMVGFWPGEVGQEDRPDGHRYIAQRYADGIPVTVVSDTVDEADTGPWRDQTTIVRRADAHEHLARLREQEGGDAVIYGSRTLWGDLLAHGLRRRAPPDGRPEGGRGRHPRLRGCPRDRPAADRRTPLRRLGKRAAELRARRFVCGLTWSSRRDAADESTGWRQPRWCTSCSS